MAITKKKSNLIEGFGLILILLSFFIQMEENSIEQDVAEQQNYQVHKKLDYIWRVASNDYSKRYPEQGVHEAIDFKYFTKSYKIYSEDYDDLTNWQKLVKQDWFTRARLALFILGSLALIIPKFIDTKECPFSQ